MLVASAGDVNVLLLYLLAWRSVSASLSCTADPLARPPLLMLQAFKGTLI
jgi:hypothetical protein